MRHKKHRPSLSSSTHPTHHHSASLALADSDLAATVSQVAAAVKAGGASSDGVTAPVATTTTRESASEPEATTEATMEANEGPPPRDMSLPLGYYEWSGLYLKRVPDGRAYVAYNQDGVSKPADAVAVSESVGFGMLASVIAGPKSDFDALLKMYDSFKNQRSGMMGWQIVDRGCVLKFNDDKFAYGNDSATDGDLDAAVALVYAAERWSDLAYLAKAKAIGEKLQAWTLNADSGLPNLGDWVAKKPTEEQDRGLGPKLFHYVSRPSDFSAAAAFATLEKVGAGDPAKWARARTQGYKALDTLLNEAALPPDFAVWDPAAKRITRPPRGVTLLEKYTDSEFSWNSCRVAWRVAARLAQDPSDAGAQAVARKLANFYNSQSKLYAGYRLPEMAPLEQYEAVAFSAPAWALLKVLGDPKAAQYESDVKRLRAYGGLAKGYYGDTTLLLAGLQLTKPAWMKK